MEKYLKNADGSFQLDENGNKILNPDYVEPSGFEMTPEIQAHIDAQIAGLKRSLATAQNSVATFKTSGEAAEARATAAETALTELREKISSGDIEIEAKEKLVFETRIDQLEGERDRLQTENTGLKDELHAYKYTGRIERASTGIIKKQYAVPAQATLKQLIKEDDDGTLRCYKPDGTPALDLNTGDPMSVEDFMTEVFVKEYPELCVADAALPNGEGPKPGTSPSGNNPFAKESMNRTVQSQLIKNDKPKARALMAAAGYDEAKIERLAG